MQNSCGKGQEPTAKLAPSRYTPHGNLPDRLRRDGDRHSTGAFASHPDGAIAAIAHPLPA